MLAIIGVYFCVLSSVIIQQGQSLNLKKYGSKWKKCYNLAKEHVTNPCPGVVHTSIADPTP